MVNDKSLIEKLRAYVEDNHLSWTQISHQLGVTQNTLTNWNKGGKISPRNRRAIVELTSAPEPTCRVTECQARNTTDPITKAMLKVWGILSERDKARIYMHALEFRDGLNPVQLVQVQPIQQVQPMQPIAPMQTIPAAQQQAAEPKAPFNKKS